jgi:hypothetical protein
MLRCHFERSEKSLAFNRLRNNNSKGFLPPVEMTNNDNSKGFLDSTSFRSE